MKTLLALTVAILALPVLAQPRASLQWGSSPSATLTQPGPLDRRNRTRYSAFAWSLGHQFRSPDLGSGSLQLTYARRTVDLRGYSIDVQGPLPEAMYSLSATSSWHRAWAGAYNSHVVLVPALENASERTIGLSDVNLSAALLLRRSEAQWSAGAGAAWTSAYGHPRLLPVLTLSVQSPSGRAAAGVIAPFWAGAHFAASPLVTVAFDARQEGGEYRTDNEETGEDEHVRYWSLTLGPRLAAALGQTDLQLSLRAGLEMRRRYDGVLSHDTVIRRELGNARVLQLALQYGRAPQLADAPLPENWP